MIDDPKCPYCGSELDEVLGRITHYWCPHCEQAFYDDNGDIELYEPMSDDDFALADFCHGGSLTDDD